jgi:magnesium transporter
MVIHRQTLWPDIRAVIHSGDFAMLRAILHERTPSDVADLMTELPPSQQLIVFAHLSSKIAVETFPYLPPGTQERLLKAISPEEAARILNAMSPDDRTRLLEKLPHTASQAVLQLLTPDERAVAVSLIEYPENSVGRLMTPDYVSVRKHWSVEQVLDHIRIHGRDSETLNHAYVVDEKGTLIDDIRIRQFLLASPTDQVSDLMDRQFVALHDTDDQETAVGVFKREDRSALPVVDREGKLVGIVTVDDVLDVAEQEATEDIQKLGGTEALDEPYMEISLPRMVKKRASWLVVLFLGEMLTATAMGFFEKEIARAVVLALFVPLIISSGGNSGSQASTLVIRALALGEVGLKDWWKVMRREIFSGLALGSVLGFIGFLRITLWSAFSDLYGPHWLSVALTVAVALVGVVLWGTLTGSMLPFVLRRLGFDPATSSAPFVATLVDVTGLVIYFSIAAVILSGSLLR